ncbi:MAG: efflux RND transporter permease subunit [Ignavibacteria bacterium]|nr:efflux RND transporter permease subunit [Ignavibacteria bacterium]
MTLTELAIKRPSLIVVLFAILGILGLFGYTQLNYNLLPKFSPPFISISTVYPGAAPQEVETTVTKIIEDAVSGVDKISSVISRSYEGVSFVQIEFTQSAKTDIALQDVIRMVNQVNSQLPTGIKQPVVTKFNPDELPILRMGATSNLKQRDFYKFLQDYVKPELAKVAGVGNITLIGGEKREIKVNLDAAKVRSYGLSLTQIQQSINLGNLDFPTGSIKENATQFVVRIAGKYSSVEELSQLVVGRSRQGGDIRLSDIAEVADGVNERTTYNRINNRECVGIYVQKQSDANAVEMSKLVKKKLNEILEKHKDINLQIEIASDSSDFTLEAANAVQFDLMLAILIVAAVMFLFLHSLRNSLIVMISIPASLISTFVFIWAFGFSLNLMTLLGLSLVIGILVDDSIVVLENIYHHLERGEDKVTASIKGRNEIGFAALSITLVDVAVFLPLSLVTGLIGNIMREFALVVVVSTLMSLVVSFTITPILASRFAKIQELTKNTLFGRLGLAFEKMFAWIQHEYGKIIGWALKNKWTQATVVLGSLSTFFIVWALFSMKLIPVEFITQSDRGEFTVTVEFPPSMKVEETNRKAQEIESMLFTMPEIKRVLTNVGTSSSAFAGTQSQNNLAEMNVYLKPVAERQKTTDQVGADIKRNIMAIAGAKVRVNPIGIFGSANESPVQVVVSGADREKVKQGAKLVEKELLSMDGTSDVRLSSEDGKLETRIEVDRQKLAALGLTIGEVGAALRIALQGNDDVKFREGTTEYDIRVRLDEQDRNRTAEIGSMTIQNRMGQQIEIKQFATIYQTTGSTKLERRDRIPALIIYAQPVGKGAADIATDLDTKLKDKLPAGTSYTYIGDVKNAREGFGDMGIAMLGGIVFVYLIMIALYDSYFYPFVNLFSVFVAPFGAFLALALGMRSMSIFTMLGLIMLIGLVMKNAILLVDRANSNRFERGMGLRNALIEAGETRLRPIVMTTVAMVFGMFPIAFSHSAGSEWKAGLALALIGGLTGSMFLTLILVPVIYFIFTHIRGLFVKEKGYPADFAFQPQNRD